MHLKKFSIQSKLLKAAQANPVSFLEYGLLDSQMLYMDTEVIPNLSLQVRSQIRELKKYASEKQFVGLSAIQGGYIDRFFIVSKEVKEQQESAWRTPKVYPIDQYKTIINPKILEICQDGEQTTEQELSPTFPMLDVKIPRYNSIKVRYYDEDMDEVEETISGFESRTFQHYFDFLMNKDLLNWRVNQGNVEIVQGHQKRLKKFSNALEEYKAQINKMKEEFPELFRPRQLIELNKQYEHLFMPSFEQDMVRRLLKNIRKDLNLNISKEEYEQIMG